MWAPQLNQWSIICLQCRRHGLIPGSGRSPGIESGNLPSILVWRILWTEEPGGLQPVGVAELDMTGQLSTHAKHHEDSNFRTCECYLIRKKGLYRCTLFSILIGRGYSGLFQFAPQAVCPTSLLKREAEGYLAKQRWASGCHVATNQGILGANRSWTRQEANTPLGSLEGKWPCCCHDFGSAMLISDF